MLDLPPRMSFPDVEPRDAVLVERLRSDQRHARHRSWPRRKGPRRATELSRPPSPSRSRCKSARTCSARRSSRRSRPAGEHTVRLGLCLRLERGHDAAVQQLLRGCRRRSSCPPPIAPCRTAAEPDALRQPGIERDVDEVVAALEFAERLARRHEVLRPCRIVLLDVARGRTPGSRRRRAACVPLGAVMQ